MKFYTIQLDSIHLTSDGTNSGEPVKLAVPGADALLSNFTGSIIPSVDGTPVMQIFETGTKGKIVEIRILTHISKTLWDSIITLINTALENSETINIKGVGDIGDFDVDSIPLLPRPFEAQEFRNGRIKTPIFRFITV